MPDHPEIVDPPGDVEVEGRVPSQRPNRDALDLRAGWLESVNPSTIRAWIRVVDLSKTMDPLNAPNDVFTYQFFFGPEGSKNNYSTIATLRDGAWSYSIAKWSELAFSGEEKLDGSAWISNSTVVVSVPVNLIGLQPGSSLARLTLASGNALDNGGGVGRQGDWASADRGTSFRFEPSSSGTNATSTSGATQDAPNGIPSPLVGWAFFGLCVAAYARRSCGRR